MTVSGAKEAGGLVAHDDGFALLTNEILPSGTEDSPGETPVPLLYRFTDGEETWKTFLGGPGVDADFGLVASPDLNGDLVFSSDAGYYAAYFVVTAYTGSASGHFGDAIRYVTPDGTLETISGASSSWGCSHNTGIAIEASDEPPFATLCAEDQGAIWLNTRTQGMGNGGVKVSNEVTINGGSNEPMGGMGGSYSGLARFVGETSYIFTWVSRGAVDLTRNDWMGDGYTTSENRTSNRNVAIALFSDKETIIGEEATSEVGAADGDNQVNWVTEGSADCSNAHVAAFDGTRALVSWEEIQSPICDFEAMGCRGEFSGTLYQLVNSEGEKVGEPVRPTDSYVAGDMVTMPDGRVCWPYVDMDWRLDAAALSLPGATTMEMSFACIGLEGGSVGDTSSSTSRSATSTAASLTTEKLSSIPIASAVDEVTPSSSASEAVTSSSTPAAQPSSSNDFAEAPASAVTSLPSRPASKKCPTKTVWETVTVTASGGGKRKH